MAHVCEEDLEEYMRQHRIDAAWSTGERVMVCVDDQPQAQHLIRRGWRIAHRYQDGAARGVRRDAALGAAAPSKSEHWKRTCAWPRTWEPS